MRRWLFFLLSDFEKLTDDENNHFTEKDIVDARSNSKIMAKYGWG